MRALVCMFFLLLAGCDFSALERQRTIMRGQVDWDTPDAVSLRKAIQACSFAGPEMETACKTRRAEAAILFSAIESCRNADLPACQKINHHFDEMHFNGLADLAELFTLEWYLSLPAQDLNTLKPANELIWAFWGWEDVEAVLTDRIIRHSPIILSFILSLVAALMLLIGRLHLKDKEKQRRALLAEAAQIEQERLKAAEDQEEAARLEKERLAEETRRQEEEARVQAEQKALLEAQQQRAMQKRLAEEKVALELAQEHERAKNALDSALKEVTTNSTKRKGNRWSTVRREPANKPDRDIG